MSTNLDDYTLIKMDEVRRMKLSPDPLEKVSGPMAYHQRETRILVSLLGIFGKTCLLNALQVGVQIFQSLQGQPDYGRRCGGRPPN